MPVLSDIQLRAAHDAEFRAALIADPQATLREAGIELPDGMSVEVQESTPTVLKLDLPPFVDENAEIAEGDLESANGGMLPLAFVAAGYMCEAIWGLAAVGGGLVGATGGYYGAKGIKNLVS
ncbi:NHLP leader peptide family RiPP precursor [Nakamurella alba]|uniref:NHLP leader peptide family RiPP precursor n=1 Tax=Nakamurella alba TaxID=2665158 RepID=UPI0018AB2BE6|nr:NHLP leader peptide family RiPP precursor [Nakamurella alba]